MDLSIEIYKFLLVFCRVAGAIRFLPAIGESFFPMTVKVAFSLGLSFLIYPLVLSQMPISEQPIFLLTCIIKETFIGIFLGLTLKLTFHSMHFAAVFIVTQSGLAFATMYDPSQKEQSTILTTLLNITVIMAIFVSNTHHMFIKTIVESYYIFQPNLLLNLTDFSQSIINTISSSFVIAFKISAPYFLIHLLLTICNGILSRLMPSFQVFFVMTPLQVLITYIILFLTLNSTIELELDALQQSLFNTL
jgi:flagellar biosynthetic protein FliR